MITNNKSKYHETKESVLTVYNSFLQLNQNELIKKITKLSQNVLESLNNEIERVKEDKFNLMVVGEAKCGKSTFINAYLGVDILPMDVKQCTSSIIEIKYGEEFLLEAEYANGEKEEIKGKDVIRQFLKENAAIDENYRSIPVPVINTEILMKTKGKPSKYDIKNLIEGVQQANVYNLSKEDYERKIHQYIEFRKATWDKIVIKLIVSYPFESEELKGIEIIDSPGVNAAGKIGDSTEQYIKNADAIMFLKPLTGAALESLDFKKFLESSSNERLKSTLFLLLTRAADLKEEDIQTLCKQAKQIYPAIENSHIFPIDSKAKMFIREVENLSPDEIDVLLDEGDFDGFVYKAWRRAKYNKKEFIKNLEELARFEDLIEAIEKFGRKAHYIRLQEIKNKISKVNTKIKHRLKHEHELYQKKYKDPEKLQIEVSRLEEQFKIIKFKMFDGVQEINLLYTGPNGKVKVAAKEISNYFEEKLNKISGKSMKEIKLFTKEAIEKYSEIFNDLQIELVDLCNQNLLNITGNEEFAFNTLEVSITDKEFSDIEAHAKEVATEEKDITTGLTRKKVETKSEFNEDRYAKVILDNIRSRFENITINSTQALVTFTEEVLSVYKIKLTDQAEEYLERLRSIREEQDENDSLIEKIKLYEYNLEKIENVDVQLQSLEKEWGDNIVK